MHVLYIWAYIIYIYIYIYIYNTYVCADIFVQTKRIKIIANAWRLNIVYTEK